MSELPHWPAAQNFLPPERTEDLVARCTPAFTALCRDMRIDADLCPYLRALYLPWAAWLVRRRARQPGTLVVGLCGGQGSGKSTVAGLLRSVLTNGFDCRVVSLSVDDIYKTREDRLALAQAVHPLFATRGVPLTHDVDLGVATLERLCHQGPGETTAIPSFDKATDTRRAQAQWPVWSGPADVVIFEGWFVGARPQTERALAEPINVLERVEDADMRWRRASNEALAADYRRLFDKLDVLALLQIDGMERVFSWRRLQEHKLAAQARDEGLELDRLAIMSDAEVDRFVMHYERLTRHILREMPDRADLVLAVDETHNPARVRINRPL